ncbi:MAG TPA: CHAT domain-containing protein [Nostocaceae cyanobacterium]|nr:CHAT domain-containing protein [Nostocaceae cyanobacterium]
MNKATKLSVLSFLNWKQGKIQRFRFLNCFLLFLVGLLSVLGSPVLAQIPTFHNSYHLAVKDTKGSSATNTVNSIVSPLQQGKTFYDSGRFAEAIKLLKQAVEEYRIQGDNLRLAAALGNLSLAYQQIGAWNEANQAITDSLNLLQGQTQSQYIQVFAQTLDILGKLQLSQGKSEAALTTWQQAEKVYQNLSNENGVLRSQINQAQAWRVQGVFRRATTILTKVKEKLQSQPDSREKTVGLRSLGDTLLLVGDLTNSEITLRESLAIAQRLQLQGEIAASLFSLGNYTRTQQSTQPTAQQKVEKISEAIAYYQQAIEISPSALIKTQAQVNQLSLLLEDPQRWKEVENLIPTVTTQIEQLPPSRSSIYAQINFAQSLMKLLTQQSSKTNLPISTQSTATVLARALQQAIDLGDQRAEAYALNSLASLYETAGQWNQAQTLTQKGLVLAQSTNAADIAYLLQWQLGRLLWRQKNIPGAIAAYDSAVQTLQSLRSDLVAVNPEVQFSFRDSVEPIYRQSVELLLQSQGSSPDDKTLEKARERIEALQLAELDNFFQEACLQTQKVALDQVVDQDNPTAAILYPIILPREIQVIVKIPNQRLKRYSTNISQTEVEKSITQLRKHLVNPAAVKAVKEESQQVYNWLVKPIESELQASGVTTLVFVLDGSLRNIPMAALFDGKRFIIEKYAVSLSVGLQLLDPQPLTRHQLRALTAGLTQPPPEFSKFSPLPGIKSEFNLINQAGVSTISLLDQEFTKEALKNKINSYPFNIVHLATHGEFSSRAENTFILAADTPIKVKDFNVILTGDNQTKVELLVLSACQTATGDDRAALGLAGAAVRAGARSTLASLWQIDDESTALFVGEFYRELKSNNITKAEALRRAQVKLLNHPNYRTPGFWAAYVLIGNWL